MIYKLFFIALFAVACNGTIEPTYTNTTLDTPELIAPVPKNPLPILHPEGATPQTRFSCPAGYTRITSDSNSFAHYLKTLPLQPDGATVHYYNGEKKRGGTNAAVVKMDVGSRDLQQCADAVMRLRAEYLYQTKQYEKIHFNLTNGFNTPYTKWRDGYRVKVSGNNTWWEKQTSRKTDYLTFRKYLTFVFSYAGTLSLSKELKPKSIANIAPGDVFIQGGSPGHAVIVIDVCKEPSGKKYFMLAQSYMPAQEIEILKNLNSPELSPWYSNQFTGALNTPEWTFNASDLKSF